MKAMKIWAHRGCSQRYPENTLLAFEKAAGLKGLTGIELDIQLSKDGEIVVIHDEMVDRTTNGTGYVKDYTLAELKGLKIDAGDGQYWQIVTLGEVLDLLADRIRQGLKINIELKNSSIPYDGMEEKVVEMVYKRGIQNSIVYSSFYAKSLEKLKALDNTAELGILDTKVSDCLYKLEGGCGAAALHPFWRGMDLPKEKLRDYRVRAWFGGHLYPEKPTGTRLDLVALKGQGITDVFLNEPEKYLVD